MAKSTSGSSVIMFHLFANIILYPDFVCFTDRGTNKKNIMISSLTDYTTHYKINKPTILSESLVSELYETVDVAVDSYGSSSEFFKSLFDRRQDKPKIFADKESYARIVCLFLKGLFPEIQSDIAYTLYIKSYQYFYGLRCLSGGFITKETLWPTLTLKDIKQQWKPIDQQLFNHYFQITDFTGNKEEFVDLIKDYISTEYMIALALSGNQYYKLFAYSQIKKLFVQGYYSLASGAQYIEYEKACLKNIDLQSIVDFEDEYNEDIYLQEALTIYSSINSEYANQICFEILALMQADNLDKMIKFIYQLQNTQFYRLSDMLFDNYTKINPLVLLPICNKQLSLS